jgi:HK97 family phage portal protein
MGVRDWFSRRSSRNAEARAVYAWNVFGNEDAGMETESGTHVSERSAFKYSVAWAAMTLIADGVASLNPEAFIENPETGEHTRTALPQWIRKPHPEILRFDIWNQLLLSVLAWGNGYAKLIRRPSDGVITGLQVLDPADVICDWDDDRPGMRLYKVNNVVQSSQDILHIMGPSLPGEPKGMSVIKEAREGIALGLTLESFGARYFSNSSQAKVVLELPGKVADEKQAMQIIKTYERFHRGKRNWHRPAIVSGGAKIHQITIPPEDAQFLQSRTFQAMDVARWFRVPPHRVGIEGKGSMWGSGLAEENLAMLQHTYRPWILRVEGALTARTPGGDDRGTVIKLNDSALLRGTYKEQVETAVAGYEKGILTRNEARRKIGEPSTDDGGDEFVSPEQPATANPRTKEQDRERKQEEAGRSLPFGQRHLPGKHNQKTHGKGGGASENGKPTLLSSKDFDAKYSTEERWYRGVGSEAGADATKRGELGSGDWGKGIYIGSMGTAQGYAGQNGRVLRLGIKDGAKESDIPDYGMSSEEIDRWAADNDIDVVSTAATRVVKNPAVLDIDTRTYSAREITVLEYQQLGYELPSGYESEVEALAKRHLPGKHDQKTHAGKISTGSKKSELSEKAQKAIDANNAKFGVTHEGLVNEFESKMTPENIAKGKGWFEEEGRPFNEDLAQRSGLTLEQTTAITSIVSPRTPWPRNKELAERVAMKFRDYDGLPATEAAKKMGGGLTATLAAGIEVARGDKTPDQAVTGLKRRSFYNNMLLPGQTDDVTVDTWMQRTAMNSASKPMSLEDSLKYMNASKGAMGGAGAGYVSIADAAREVAANHNLTPDQVQSVYWVAVSGSFEGTWGRND